MFFMNYNKSLKNKENYIKKNSSNEINDNKIHDKNEIKLKQIENIKKQKEFQKADNKYCKNISNKTSNKKIYSVIPLNIFQFWHDVELPVQIKKI